MPGTLTLPSRILIGLVASVFVFVAAAVAWPRPAAALPPNIPSKSVIQSELNGLTVAAEGSMTGYDRDKFPHWVTISGNCNARETVLKRDADEVTVGSDCYPTSGRWYSQWDGVVETSASDIHIDHQVPLAEAWRSGASSWSTDRREDFANDVTGTELIAVTASVNMSKSDRDPAEWKPPRTGAYCLYAKMWIHSKHQWNLRLQSAEKSALQSMLDTCYY